MSRFDVFLDHDSGLVKVTAVGELFQNDGEEIITVARTKAMQHGYNIFYDIRQATTTVLFSNWFELPRKLKVFKDEKAWQIKAAVLVSLQDKAIEEYKFYELVTENMGFRLKTFFDENEALNWLGKKFPV